MNLQENLAAYYEQAKAKKGIQKAVADVTPRPFYDRFEGAALVAQIAQYSLFSIISITAGFFYVWAVFSSMMPNILAGVLAAAVLIFWEAFKSFCINQSFEGWFVYKKISVVFILFALGALGISSYSSIVGAKDAAVYFTDQSDKIITEAGNKTAALDKDYQNRLKETQSKLDALEALKKSRGEKKGGSAWLTNVENQQSQNYSAILLQLSKEREAVLAETKTAANIAAEKSAGNGQKNALALIVLSGINESMILLCIWFVWWFKNNVKNEQIMAGEALGEESTDHLSIIRLAYQNMFPAPNVRIEMQDKASQLAAEMPNKPFLGFQINDNQKEKGGAYMPETKPNQCLNVDRLNDDRLNGQRLNDEALNKEPLKDGERVCKQCGSKFLYKHWNATYCGDKCRGQHWEEKTGAKFKKPKPKG
jgi:hypothetical protein